MTTVSIIIKQNSDISAISSLLQQNNDNWECFIINNTVKNIEQYIIQNPRFYIVKNTEKPDIVFDTIKKAHGEYVLLINSDDILVNDAIDSILHTIYFTNADTVKFKSKSMSEILPETIDTKCKFQYVFNNNNIMQYVFNNLSEFCFKKDIINKASVSDTDFLTNALMNVKDITVTTKTCIISKNQNDINVDNIIDNYKQNGTELSKNFWQEYFRIITPDIIKQAVKNNDKQSFLKFCRAIPLNLIPLRYRFICYILKKTNK